ncbi:MAG: type II CRISPR RNA-guided endonuclease Cas9 [Bacteroidetes bacterium]|nr:type II CRISPR RNA-guided endonuclease Cas9 [Bacteroidota bacterium]
MSLVLGLDLGTTSIGWALINSEKKQLVDCGVRIFPIGVNVDKTGTEAPKNAQRRTSRQIRRQYHRFKLRRQNLAKRLRELNMLPEEQSPLSKLTSEALFSLRANAVDTPDTPAKKLTLEELGRVFIHLNHHRGFKSSRKQNSAAKKDEDSGKIKTEIAELAKVVHDGGFITVGRYFHSLFNHRLHNPDEPEFRIRGRHVGRELYLDEFDRIWISQRKFYPEILTGGPEDGNKPKNTTYYQIRNFCIFYQRPLKSQRNLISKCRFEPNRRVTPRANPEFQEFRLWQDLEKVRINGEGRWDAPLTLEEKELLFQHWGLEKEFKASSIPSKLKLGKRFTVNDPDMKLSGQTTWGQIKKAIGAEKFSELTELQKNQLWNLLYFFEDDDKAEHLTSTLESLFHWERETAQACAKIHLEPDYSRLSQFAIKKMLPFMRQGMGYSDAAKAAGYTHSKPEGTSAGHEMADRIVIDPRDRVRNPVVSRALSETTKLVNAILKVYGRPDEIRVEMTRELKSPKDKRQKMRRENSEKEQIRKNLVDFLNEKTGRNFHAGASEVAKLELWMEMGLEQDDFFRTEDLKRELSPQMREKFKLWMEGNRISVYSGKVITFSQMLDASIQIEHIIPYSRSMDNSFMNKALCEIEINKEKGNRTALEYFESKGPEALKAFKDRVKRFPNQYKRERFLKMEVSEEFNPGAIENTGYIAKEAKKHLGTICKKVSVTNGAATAILRKKWGLGTLLSDKKEERKDRSDHRHHAIDAIVIACTNLKYFRILTEFSKFNSLSQLENDFIDSPWATFRAEVKEFISKTLITYRADKRLIEKSSYKIKAGKGQNNWKKQTGISIRGSLHNDSVFGEVQKPGNHHRPVFVIRRPISSLSNEKHFDQILDGGIRKVVIDHWIKAGRDFKKAFGNPEENPVYSNPALNIKINSIRMEETSSSMVDRFQGSNRIENKGKQFVEPGNNFLYVLYGTPDGKERDLEMISFFEAARRKVNKEELFPMEKNGKPVLIALKQGDLVVPYETHPDEINISDPDLGHRIYRVIKFDINGNVVLGLFSQSNIKADKDKAPLVLRKVANTLKVEKVKINILGKIMRS